MVNTPRSRDVACRHAKTGTKLLENVRRQPFCHNISELLSSWYLQNPYVAEGHTLVDEVDVQLNVLGAMMMNGVGRYVDGGDIVAVDQCGADDWA
jgi:hypothetical protein